MGLLDDDYVPPYKPPENGKRYRKQTALSQEERDSELNNLGHDLETEDYSNSRHLDY